MVIVILSVLLLISILYVLSPIFFGPSKNEFLREAPEDEKIKELQEHKMVIFNLLKDLEFEYKTGKISDNDFAKLKEEYKTKVILIYQKIDQIKTSLKPGTTILTNNGQCN
ncbi:MAG: hypothetical protein AB1498_09195 [bacterium]